MTTWTTIAATGALRLSWLLLAFPLFGAAGLLLGGRRTDPWGHPRGGRDAGRLVRLRGDRLLHPARRRPPQPGPAPVLVYPGGGPAGEHGPADRPALDQFRAADHRGRLADPHLLHRLHGARQRPAPVLRLPEPVHRRDAAARAVRQLPRPVRRVGRRRP